MLSHHLPGAAPPPGSEQGCTPFPQGIDMAPGSSSELKTYSHVLSFEGHGDNGHDPDAGHHAPVRNHPPTPLLAFSSAGLHSGSRGPPRQLRLG